MIRRRAVLAGIAGTLASPRPLAAQTPPREGMRRLGVLMANRATDSVAEAFIVALTKGLRALDWREGGNLRIDWRWTGGDPALFDRYAAELVAWSPDVLLAQASPSVVALKRQTSTIPIVFTMVSDPEGQGFVGSLAHPGGNVTGLSAFATELAGKRVELLKEARPSIARVGFLQNMGNPASPPQWEAVQAVAKALGLSAEPFDVRNTNDIANAFARIAANRLDALSVGIDALTQANAKTIVSLAGEHKVLTAYPAREFVDVGGLLSYGPSYPDLYYRAAGMIDKIFKGAKPGDLPVEQPTKLELVINLKTAKALGLEIPPNLLARADEAIE